MMEDLDFTALALSVGEAKVKLFGRFFHGLVGCRSSECPAFAGICHVPRSLCRNRCSVSARIHASTARPNVSIELPTKAGRAETRTANRPGPASLQPNALLHG